MEAMKRKVPTTMAECFELIERELLSTPRRSAEPGLLFLDAGHTATGWGGLSTGGGGIGLGGSSIGGR